MTVAKGSGDGRAVATAVQATPEPNWVNWKHINNLLLALMFGDIMFYAIGTAREREIFLRRIPGLDAVDEAIGRATEGAQCGLVIWRRGPPNGRCEGRRGGSAG